MLELREAERHAQFRKLGVGLMLQEIHDSLHAFGTDFDVWFSELSLHDSGAVEASVRQLKDSGALYEAEGAWWLRSTEHGDDKDRVVIKSDGTPAYIAGDIAYLRDKLARGANRCIYMLGADHHGYTARLKAVAAALGENPDVVEVLIGQMVNLVKDGEPFRMSKRAGTIVTLEDFVEAVGVDAARYSLVRSSVDSIARRGPGPAGQPHERQPGVLRPVRARPAGVAVPQRGGRGRRTRRRVRSAGASTRGRPDPHDRRVPGGRARGRRAA